MCGLSEIAPRSSAFRAPSDRRRHAHQSNATSTHTKSNKMAKTCLSIGAALLFALLSAETPSCAAFNVGAARGFAGRPVAFAAAASLLRRRCRRTL